MRIVETLAGNYSVFCMPNGTGVSLIKKRALDLDRNVTCAKYELLMSSIKLNTHLS